MRHYDQPGFQPSLVEVPSLLKDAFRRSLDKLSSSSSKDRLSRILQVLTYSKRALDVQAIADLLATEEEFNSNYSFLSTKRPSPKDILKLCSDLVLIRDTSHGTRLQLVHHSVALFVKTGLANVLLGRSHREKDARKSLLDTCIGYLSTFPGVPKAPTTQEAFPLLRYCARELMQHADYLVRTSRGTSQQIVDFASKQSDGYLLWRRLVFKHRSTLSGLENRDFLINYAATRGLRNLMNVFSTISPDADKDPLQAASFIGDAKQVNVLLLGGAIPTATTTSGMNALQAACYNGHTPILRLFLKNGADINARAKDSNSALYYACYQGHMETVRLLLESGAEIFKPEITGESHPLQVACHND